jgi:hypothetical protein
MRNKSNYIKNEDKYTAERESTMATLENMKLLELQLSEPISELQSSQGSSFKSMKPEGKSAGFNPDWVAKLAGGLTPEKNSTSKVGGFSAGTLLPDWSASSLDIAVTPPNDYAKLSSNADADKSMELHDDEISTRFSNFKRKNTRLENMSLGKSMPALHSEAPRNASTEALPRRESQLPRLPGKKWFADIGLSLPIPPKHQLSSSGGSSPVLPSSTVTTHVDFLYNLCLKASRQISSSKSAEAAHINTERHSIEILGNVSQIIVRSISIHIMLSDTEKWSIRESYDGL